MERRNYRPEKPEFKPEVTGEVVEGSVKRLDLGDSVAKETKDASWRKAVECEHLIAQGDFESAMVIIEDKVDVWEHKYVHFLMNKVAKAYPQLFFNKYKLIEKQRWAKSLLKRAVDAAIKDKRPWLVVQNAALFKREGYARKVLMGISKKNGIWAVGFVDGFKDMPYAADVLKVAAKEMGGSVFGFVPTLANVKGMGKVLVGVADSSPGPALEYVEKFIDVKWEDGKDWSEKIVKVAARYIPWIALKKSAEFKDKSWAPKVIADAAKIMPWMALKYADQFTDKGYAAEIIRTAAKADPKSAIKHYAKYANALHINPPKVLADAKKSLGDVSA